MQKITLIAAYAEDQVIGINNDIPWYLPEDFAFFKAYTLHKTVIMGRKTWDSLPKKPLPNRRNIVLTKQTNIKLDGAEIFNSLTEALNHHKNEQEIIIMGGEQIYIEALPIATDLRLTEVKLTVAGDAFFPNFSKQVWQEKERTSHISTEGITFDLVHWQRKTA